MILAVLSGKGGAGKTFVSVNLAVTAGRATYIDCDVEEPNGRLFLKPKDIKEKPVSSKIPEFDAEKCSGCRKCVDFCQFNALVYVGNRPVVFPEVCHSCGGCAIVCPSGAVKETERQVGTVETGWHGNVRVVTGILNPGEASAVPVIKSALETGCTAEELTVLDCPPGSGCSVLESVSSADYCILVAEPTAFGLHNFQMVAELVRLMRKPWGVVINREDGAYPPLEEFCMRNAIPILGRIPYSKKLAGLCAAGQIACTSDEETGHLFARLLYAVREEAET